MKKLSLILFVCLALHLLMAGQAQAKTGQKCRVVSTSTKTTTLKKLYAQYSAQPLVILGGSVYYCPCGARNMGGDTEGRSLGGDTEGRLLAGDTEGRNIGGDTEGRNMGGDTEGRSMGGDTEGRLLAGDTEGRSMGGDTEGRSIGGDTEGRNIGGDTEGRLLAGDTEGRSLGGDTEGRSIGGDTMVISCSLTPICRGFIVNNTLGKTFSFFNGMKVISTNNTCIE